MENYITANGDALIHEACEDGINSSVLADAKMNWVLSHHNSDNENEERLVERLITYSKREDEARQKLREAEAGTSAAKHYQFRLNYYVELNKLMKAAITEMVTEALARRL